MANDWGRVCYRHAQSKYPDGYARQHWLPLDQAEAVLVRYKAQGRDCFVEVKDKIWNRASGERRTV